MEDTSMGTAAEDSTEQVKIVVWDEKVEQQALDLLNKYKETSVFLLANLKTYGPKLTDGTYSGDYKCLVQNDKVVGIFALTRIGNLTVQTDRMRDYSKVIIDECAKGVIPLKGVVGDWGLAKPLWDYALQSIPGFKEKFSKKEILFQIDMDNLRTRESKHEVRYLKDSDYKVWGQLNNAYLLENSLDQGEAEEARYKRFLQDLEKKYWLGLFIDNQLVSKAAYLANIDNLGLIGGVYTLPKVRRQGLAKELVHKLLEDGKTNKNLRQVVLFTHVDNIAGIKVYESLGFRRIGYYGLFFGGYS